MERGLTRWQIEARVQRGVLTELWPGVYRFGHRFVTPRGRLLGALLAIRGEGVLCLRAAGSVWDLVPARKQIEVITFKGRGRKLDGIDARRWRLSPSDWVHHEDLALTTPMRTVFDLASVLSDQRLMKVLEQAERTQVLDAGVLRRLLAGNPHRKGAGTLCSLLDTYDHDLARLRSELEKIVTRVCRRLDHPMPERNVLLRGRERDFVWRDPLCVVEADGRRWHGTAEARERDTVRDQELTLAGIPSVRVTFRQARSGHAERVIERLLRLDWRRMRP